METLKILFSTSFYPPFHLGGDATHVKYLAEELARRGHEIHILHSLDAFSIKRRHSNNLSEESQTKNIFIHRLKSPLSQIDPLMIYINGRSPYVEKQFSRILQEIHPDVVHHHNISLLGYPILNKNNNGYLSLYTSHDYWLICQTNNLFRNRQAACDEKHCNSCSLCQNRFPQLWRNSKAFKKAVNSIDLLISPSEYMRNRLLKEIKIQSLTLPNFAPYPPEKVSNAEYSNYFLFVGMLEPHKGILNLLNVFKTLKNSTNSKLIIVGEGSLSKYVSNFIKKNALSERIVFLGFVDNRKLYSLYKNATALIIPSIWPENSPMVTLEALSVGTPVLSSNCGGLPEIIEKIDRNWIFNDISELKDQILSFPHQSLNRTEIRKAFEQNFSPQAYVDGYLKAISSITPA